MISLVNGIVRSISQERAIVEVGGVGLSVSITGPTSAHLNLGASVQLFTTLVVREDSLTLFGFLDDESRSTFELVQTVSGIGPKVALAIMGAHTPDSLARAISQEDIKAIEKVPGIGRKGAQIGKVRRGIREPDFECMRVGCADADLGEVGEFLRVERLRVYNRIKLRRIFRPGSGQERSFPSINEVGAGDGIAI